MEFTGERYIPQFTSCEISYEHWHRYLYASQFVENKSVLDIACGEGYGSYFISNFAKKIVGVDLDADIIKYAEKKYSRPNLIFKTGPVTQIPVAGTHKFDVIVSFETIEHISEEEQNTFLKEVKRLLKPGGIFIISTPNRLVYSDIPNYKNKFHIKEFYLDEFREFLHKSFKNVKFLGHDVYTASFISDSESKTNKLVEFNLKYTDQGFQLTEDRKQDRYILSICSDDEIRQSVASISFDPDFDKSTHYVANQSLFVDTGNGYSEDEKIIKNSFLEVGQQIILEYDLKGFSPIKKLRFDPVENYCQIIINKVGLRLNDNKVIEIKYKTNACAQNKNVFDFDTNDPQIYLEPDNISGIKKVIIELEYLSIGADSIKQTLEKKNLEIHSKDQELKTIENSFSQKNDELQQKNARIVENEKLIFQQESRIQQHEEFQKQKQDLIKRLESENSNKEKLLQQLENSIKDFDNLISQKENQIEKLEAQNDKQETIVKQQEKAIQQYEEFQKQKQDLIERLESENSNKEKLLQQLENSIKDFDNVITQRENQIEKLEEQNDKQEIFVKQQEEAIQQHEKFQKQKQDLIERLESENSNKEKLLQQQENSIKDFDNLITQRENQIEKLEAQNDKQKIFVKQQKKAIQQHEEFQKQKQDLIERLESENSNKEKLLQQQENSIKDFDNLITQRENQIEKLEAQNDKQKIFVKQQEKAIQQHEEFQKQKQNSILQLESENSNKEKLIQQQEETIQTQNYKINSQKNDIKTLIDLTDKKESDIQSQSQNLRSLNMQLSDVKKSISFKLGYFLTRPFRFIYKLFSGYSVGSEKRWFLFRLIGIGLVSPFKMAKHINRSNIRTLFHALKHENPKQIIININRLLSHRPSVPKQKNQPVVIQSEDDIENFDNGRENGIKKNEILIYCDTAKFLPHGLVAIGWAISTNRIKLIEIYLDNEKIGDAKYGHYRQDVQEIYPTFNNSKQSGFLFYSDIYKYSQEKADATLLIKAIDLKGNIAKTKVPLLSPLDQYRLYLEDIKLTDSDILKIKEKCNEFLYKPKFTLITFVRAMNNRWFNKYISSIENQFYNNWELLICFNDSLESNISKELNELKLKNKKIQIIQFEPEQREAFLLNNAIKQSNGDFIGFINSDDELNQDALFEVVKALNQDQGIDFIYTDEDKIDIGNNYIDPYFKPDINLDLLLSYNYISQFSVIKKSIGDKLGWFRDNLDGACYFDLYLRIIETTNKIHHIPKILYHWRDNKSSSVYPDENYNPESEKKVLIDYLKRQKIDGTIEKGLTSNTFRIKRNIEKQDLVSIIIPFKDKIELLKNCISSIINKTDYSNYEIILVSNNSVDKKTFKYAKKLTKIHSNVRFYEYNIPFNYSLINNWAVQKATGKYILLLNNDIEVISEEWLSAMVEHIQREEVGAVGAKLLFADNTIQHSGIVIGLGEVAKHAHKYFPDKHDGYFYRANCIQNVSACTAACLLVKKEIYDKVNGLDENLVVAYNDVDFCLKIIKEGYLIVYTPFAKLYHYESISRGTEDTSEKMDRIRTEVDFMKHKWKMVMERRDPNYHPCLINNIFGIDQIINQYPEFTFGIAFQNNDSNNIERVDDNQLNYCIDEFRVTGFYIILKGWVFSETKNIKSLQFMLKQKNKIKVYDITYFLNRLDIFRKYRDINALKCGFICKFEQELEGRFAASLIVKFEDKDQTIIDIKDFDISNLEFEKLSDDIYTNREKYSQHKHTKFNKISLYINSAGNYFFSEIAQLMAEGLKALGIEVGLRDEKSGFSDNTDWHIIIAPHEFFCIDLGKQLAKKKLPPNIILFNTEQPSSSWFELASQFFKYAYVVWDIDYNSAKRLSEKFVFAYYLPLGYLQDFTLFSNVYQLPNHYGTALLPPEIKCNSFFDKSFFERPIDIIFIGHASERRQGFFAKHAPIFSKYRCYFHLSDVKCPVIPGETSYMDTDTVIGLIQRSKILINIHHGLDEYFEWHRIVMQGIWQKTLVITEPCSIAPPFRANIDFVQTEIDNMSKKCEQFLGSPRGHTEAQTIIERGYKTLTENCKITNYLKPLIEALEFVEYKSTE